MKKVCGDYFQTVIFILLFILSVTGSGQNKAKNILKDIDGNLYHPVSIGNQTWMMENLKVTRYSNGDTIETTIPAGIPLSGVKEPKYEWPCMNSDSLTEIYGRFYTWYAASDSRGICPEGWHLPSDEEFCTLENYIEPRVDTNCKLVGHRGKNTGGMLKEAGLRHWSQPNSGADNRSHFAGLPAGIRYQDGVFTFLGDYGYFWTSTEHDSTQAWSRRLYHNTTDVKRDYYFKKDAFSIRCVKN